MTAQWERLFQNEGIWQGSFTRLSPAGDVLEDIPSIVSLEALNQGETMRQIVRKLPVNQDPEEQVYEYRSLGKGVLFFENGAFSQGSIQWGPFSEFGAELGLIWGDRRLRLVQIFGKDNQLAQLTLIREARANSNAPERPPLTVADLLGTWQGEAITLYPDLRPDDTYETRLIIEQSDRNQLTQTLQMGKRPQIVQSTGCVQGSQIQFEPSTQVLCLPDGATATGPTSISTNTPLFLEVGWLLEPGLRQRMIRYYDERGAWSSLTLVTERRDG
ncbi:MAG: DUF3598 family protein [Leptolyngbyaceae cyanobacterium SM1_1_3]|nr:DUF3598 family protein [Leptolyngbyaceae cyanobacterium SM1_1_3]NJN02094.1 DUF3598 family protein [Leptolyngbyaceae cyanobacterium RM1_1_2]NJO09703.1 DUF3598 family protein [Leptolyngbyaceae cyanobacterium SL_1_1]